MNEKGPKDVPSIRRPDAGKSSEEIQAGVERIVPNNALEALLNYLAEERALTPGERAADEKDMEAEDKRYAEMPQLPLPESRDEKTLEQFFTDEVLHGRVVFCPQIPEDVVDFEGETEPGFILIQDMKFRGEKTIADRLWLQGRAYRLVPGLSVPVITNFFHFPVRKFRYSTFTQTEERDIFEYLLKRLKLQALPKP